jgi:ABC-type branched-subunit amino acid transport system ATPase component
MQVSFVVGDIYILLATACWALYSWLLTQRNEPDEIRSNQDVINAYLGVAH